MRNAPRFEVEASQVLHCRQCNAQIALQRSYRTGNNYPTDVFVDVGALVTSRTLFHTCKQEDIDRFKQQKANATKLPLLDKKAANFASIRKLFENVTGLKFPKIWLQTSTGQPVMIYRTGQKSKHPGELAITDGGGYGRNIYFGRIDKAGELYPSNWIKQEVIELLQKLAADPVGVAAQYGKLTGNCSFCYRRLEDARSTDVGYGPVCAKKWHLPWGSSNGHPHTTPAAANTSTPSPIQGSSYSGASAASTTISEPWTKTGERHYSIEASTLDGLEKPNQCPSCSGEFFNLKTMQAKEFRDPEGEVTHWEVTCPCGKVDLTIFND